MLMYQPFDMFDAALQDMMCDLATPMRLSARLADKASPQRVRPRYAITSDGDAAVVQVELPGVAETNIDIEAKDGSVTVSARRLRRAVWNDEKGESAAEQGQAEVAPVRENGEKSSSDGGDADAEMTKDGAAESAPEGRKVAEGAAECEQELARGSEDVEAVYHVEFKISKQYDTDSAHARYENGLLSLVIPRKVVTDTRRNIPLSLS